MDEFTPEQLDQLIALGAIGDEQAQILRQMEMANELRKAPIRRGGMAGRVYVGDPFGAAAGGLQRVLGHRQMKDLEGKFSGSLDRQTAGRRLFLDALRRKGGTPPIAPPQNNGVTTYPLTE